MLLPKFRAPKAQRIDIFLQSKASKGYLQRVPAQQWLRYRTQRYYDQPLERLPYGVVLTN